MIKFKRWRGLAACLPPLLLAACQTQAGIKLFLPDGETVFMTQQVLSSALRVEVSTLAGDGTAGLQDGPGAQARFRYPRQLTLGSDGSLYVADTLNHAIRKITPDGNVSTLAGNGKPGFADGPGTAASFYRPSALLFDALGQLLVSDSYNHRIRGIGPEGTVSTLAGTGRVKVSDNGPEGEILYPEALAYDARTPKLFVASTGNGKLKTVKGSGFENLGDANLTLGYPEGLAYDSERRVLYVAETASHRVYPLPQQAAKPAWNQPASRTFSSSNEYSEGNNRYAGLTDGPIDKARFRFPAGIGLDTHGQLYVADAGNHSIRLISLKGDVLTLAGNGQRGRQDGNGPEARFDGPRGLAVSADGNLIYVADTNNHQIRRIRITRTAQASE